MEKRKQISFILPPYMLDPFYEEIERRMEKSGNDSSFKTQLIVEALSRQLKVISPTIEKTRNDKPITTRKSISPEDLADRLKAGEYYNLTTLSEISGLSRTTVRNIINKFPEWFNVDGEGHKKYSLAREVLRPSRATEKRKGKRRRAKAKSKEAKEAIKNVDEPKKLTRYTDENGDIMVKEKGKEDRRLGFPDIEVHDFVMDLFESNQISERDLDTYSLKNYEENPEEFKTWAIDQEDIPRLLKRRARIIPKLEKLYQESKS